MVVVVRLPEKRLSCYGHVKRRESSRLSPPPQEKWRPAPAKKLDNETKGMVNEEPLCPTAQPGRGPQAVYGKT